MVALVILVAALCVGSARTDSATVDEPAHIAAGMIDLSQGWIGFYHGQVPLMNSISAVPLAAAGYRMPDGWKGGPDEWSVGRRFIYQSGYPAHRVLFLARLPAILLFLALCVVVYLFVLRQTGSVWWALTAAAMTGFCPNLMAHGRLATVDCGMTVFAFVSTLAMFRLIEEASIARAVLLGISVAAAMLTKISALILGPYFVIVIAGAFALRRVRDWRRFTGMLALACGIAIVAIETFLVAEMSLAYVAAQYPDTPRFFVPFVYYSDVVRYIRTFYSQSNEILQYRLGNISRSGWRDYYLVAFLLKTTLPAIILFIAAVVAGIRSRSFELYALLTFVVLFMAAASAGHIDLGIRYVLPIYPFIYAAIAIAFGRQQQTRGLRVVIAILVLWHAGENLISYPSHIAYFNELIGSTRNADKFLIDSNLDWGQDLRRLDQWCRQRGIKQISVHYFGGADIAYDMRWTQARIISAPPLTPLPRGYFAVSRHLYRLSRGIWGIDYDACLAAQHARYVTSIGGSINVYEVGVTAR